MTAFNSSIYPYPPFESLSPRLRALVLSLRRSLARGGIDSVLAALSGGPDSVLTFHILRLAAAGLPGLRLGAAHVNFHLRGKESMRDEAFVRRLLEAAPEVTPHFISFDTASYCESRRISTEMGARELRHDWFDSLRASHGYSHIATGHNADDNEETLLLNLLRGSGTRGLRGMTADNGRILRPLLHTSRSEILAMLAELFPASGRDSGTDSSSDSGTAPPYITDSTNLTCDYRRNFLRHRIIPELELRWPGTHTALQTSLRLLGEENLIVEHAIAQALEGTDEILPLARIREFPSPLTLVHRWILPHGGTSTQAAEMVAAMVPADSQTPHAGGRWRLPEAEVTASAKGLRIAATGNSDNSGPRRCVPQVLTEKIIIDDAEARSVLINKIKKCTPGEIYLPCDPASLEWRLPRPGERMRTGASAKKLITRILKEAGVTAALRSRTTILADPATDEAIWIPGVRRSVSHLIEGQEDIIWKITLCEYCGDATPQ